MNEQLRPKKIIDAIPAAVDAREENAEQRLRTVERELSESFELKTDPDTLKTRYHDQLSSDPKLCEETLTRLNAAFTDKFGMTPDEFSQKHGRGDESGGLEQQLFEMAKAEYLARPGNNERSLAKLLGSQLQDN